MKKKLTVVGFALCLGLMFFGIGGVAYADSCLQNCADDLQICLSKLSANASTTVCTAPYDNCATKCPDASAEDKESTKEGVLSNYRQPGAPRK